MRRRASSPRVRGFLSVGRRQDVFRARAGLRRFFHRYVLFSGDGGFPVVLADVLVLRRDLVAFLIRGCGRGFVFFGFRMEFRRLRSEKLPNPERAGQSFERVVKLFDRSRRNLRKRAVHGVLRHDHRRGRMDARFLQQFRQRLPCDRGIRGLERRTGREFLEAALHEEREERFGRIRILRKGFFDRRPVRDLHPNQRLRCQSGRQFVL